MLPVQDFSNTKDELRRLAGLGFTAAMLPAVTPPNVPRYNDPKWDEVFALAGELGVVFVLHTGTGLEAVVQERGAGAAVINYTLQMADAIRSTMYLVAGGVLDRNPKTKVAFIESGASWMAGVAERMDEVYDAHFSFVHPKLSIKPSEIIKSSGFASETTGAALWTSCLPVPSGRSADEPGRKPAQMPSITPFLPAVLAPPFSRTSLDQSSTHRDHAHPATKLAPAKSSSRRCSGVPRAFSSARLSPRRMRECPPPRAPTRRCASARAGNVLISMISRFDDARMEEVASATTRGTPRGGVR